MLAAKQFRYTYPCLVQYQAGGGAEEEFSLLSEELLVNPFLQWNDPDIPRKQCFSASEP